MGLVTPWHPRPGIEHVSPALADRFLTTGPPEKSPSMYLQVKVTQSCLTLCDPMDCSHLGSSAHRILQARILEWVTISFSRGSSQPRDQTHISMSPALAGGFFTANATWAENLLGEITQLVRFVLNGNVNKLDIATGLLCFHQAAKIKVCSTRR